MKALRISTIAAAILAASSTITFADHIDGRWCSPLGRSIIVNGPQVTTPEGAQVTANYDRHHIDYIIPTGEPRAGDTFSADQLGEDRIRVTIVAKSGTPAPTPEIWTPCKPIS